MKDQIQQTRLSREMKRRLDTYYSQADAIILARQNPITGLLPASTAITVHGDYTDAWVRDNVYSILAVWGLALAYRRNDEDEGRAYHLEQSVVKLMRGLLTAMMKQSGKVESFKQTLNPLDALHAKYNTTTGEAVVGDADWGHLQLDATALFLLMLAQMTASGLRIVFTLDEVDFVQNLAHYLGRAHHTPDYGIWERGHKMNEGRAEVNASSVGMAKAALEALSGLDLFGGHGGAASVVHVPADDIAGARQTLEALLPRESESKETDAALLSVIGYPAYAVEDLELVKRTRADIVNKLQGRHGCKRFLRDGHQTVVEDHQRMHYEAGELARFEHVESEWPLFFTYLLLDGAVRGSRAQTEHYFKRLDDLLIMQDGEALLPELYYVPADRIEAEKAEPGSQDRVANDNLPLVWAQSLYLLGNLLRDGLLQPGDIDPLNRSERVGRSRSPVIQVALLTEDSTVQRKLRRHGIQTQTLAQIRPVQVRQSAQLVKALSQLGANQALGLSGRPLHGLGSLITSQVFELGGGETCVFLPPFLKPRDFYLHLDNSLLTAKLKAELGYIHRHWDQPGEPLVTLLISTPMLQAGGHEVLLDLLRGLQNGSYQDIPVRTGRLQDMLPAAGRAQLNLPADILFTEPPMENRAAVNLVPNWGHYRVPTDSQLVAWRQEADTTNLQAQLDATENPFKQIELLGVLWQRLGPDAHAGADTSLRQRVEVLYAQACRARAWTIIRQAAGLLGKFDDDLETAVADIVVRQHRLALDRVYNNESVIVRPLGLGEIADRINHLGCADPRERVLTQEILLMLAMLVKAEPERFRGILTLRTWQWLTLLTNRLAREHNLDQGDAFDRLLSLSPSEIFEHLRWISAPVKGRNRVTFLTNWRHDTESAALKPVRFTRANDPAGVEDWTAWRENHGVLTRVPEDFYSQVWQLLRQFHGLVVGDQLDGRNYLDSATLLADTTPAEKGFALRVDQVLNNIQVPQYRQLSIEALQTLFAISQANPSLLIDADLVLDVLIETAVQLHWAEQYPAQNVLDEWSEAKAWENFYASPPHRVANALVAALKKLLAENWSDLTAAA